MPLVPHPSQGTLVAPIALSGLLMAAYLLVRPYGDSPSSPPDPARLAAAFASEWWVVAHVCGAVSLVLVAVVALRLAALAPSWVTRLARLTGLAGAALVLPYYGAETFGLHSIGQDALSGDLGALRLVPLVRDQPVALVTFGAGLLLLAVSGLAMAWAWTSHARSWAAWPFGVAVALVLPHFYLPPAGRMAFGVVTAVTAGLWVAAILRRGAAHRVAMEANSASGVPSPRHDPVTAG